LISRDEREWVYGTAVYLLNVCPLDGNPALAGNGSLVACSVCDRGMVNEFYRIALALTSHDALDKDTSLAEEVRNAARALVRQIAQRCAGAVAPDETLDAPGPK
jgi:hypothetical protein